MRFVTFRGKDGVERGGVLEGATIRPLARGGVLEHIASGAAEPALSEERVAVGEVELLAPVPRPPRVFGIGLNYREHATESKMAVQTVPTVFIKLSSSVVGPGAEVLLPPEATEPDYEAELAVVIGKPGYRVKAEDAERHVFGYTIVNDVSARGVQLATTQWTLGKSFPTFTPMGPAVVTKDEIADPHALGIRLTLAGEVMQDASTRDLLFRIPELIAYISASVPLEAGDVISTGTPPGVGLGRTPKRWLRDAEEMVIEVEGIGELRNRTRVIE